LDESFRVNVDAVALAPLDRAMVDGENVKIASRMLPTSRGRFERVGRHVSVRRLTTPDKGHDPMLMMNPATRPVVDDASLDRMHRDGRS
jgi:hypothetical protein